MAQLIVLADFEHIMASGQHHNTEFRWKLLLLLLCKWFIVEKVNIGKIMTKHLFYMLFLYYSIP